MSIHYLKKHEIFLYFFLSLHYIKRIYYIQIILFCIILFIGLYPDPFIYHYSPYNKPCLFSRLSYLYIMPVYYACIALVQRYTCIVPVQYRHGIVIAVCQLYSCMIDYSCIASVVLLTIKRKHFPEKRKQYKGYSLFSYPDIPISMHETMIKQGQSVNYS